MIRFSDYHTRIFRDLEQKCTRAAAGPGTVLVIGAGLSRTGTLSLKAALTELLGGRCYHGIDLLGGDQEDLDVAVRATFGRMEPDDWRSYLLGKNYVAAVDVPVNLRYKEERSYTKNGGQSECGSYNRTNQSDRLD